MRTIICRAVLVCIVIFGASAFLYLSLRSAYPHRATGFYFRWDEPGVVPHLEAKVHTVEKQISIQLVLERDMLSKVPQSVRTILDGLLGVFAWIDFHVTGHALRLRDPVIILPAETPPPLRLKLLTN